MTVAKLQNNSENVSRVGMMTVRSLLVSDLVDDGIMENSGIKVKRFIRAW